MKKFSIFFLLTFICLGASARLGYAQELINIVCTIGQITDITKEIGGTRVHVIGLMGAGVDPHLYKASESDVRKLSNADMILYSGINLEAKMGSVFKRMGSSKKIVAVSESIPDEFLLDSVQYAGHFDPHVWFDVELWMKSSEKIRDTLIEFDPDGKSIYEQNFIEVIKELEDLDRYIKVRAQELTKDQRVLVTAHDAFRYFGRKYEFEVVGLQGISTESKAGVKDVIELAKFITERKIKAIFVESSVPERNIKAVQDAVKAQGWDVAIGGELFSDALGNEGTVEGTYVGMVKHNIDTIVDALKSGKGEQH